MKVRWAIAFAALAVISMPVQAETPSSWSPQTLQAGLFADVGRDDGDLNLYVAGQLSWVVWDRAFVHYGGGLEQKLESFVRMRNSLGAGYLFETGRSSIPVWLAGGVTTTGLWGHYLNREFAGVGVGYRHHVSARVGIGVNLETAFYGDGVDEQRVSMGLVYTRR